MSPIFTISPKSTFKPFKLLLCLLPAHTCSANTYNAMWQYHITIARDFSIPAAIFTRSAHPCLCFLLHSPLRCCTQLHAFTQQLPLARLTSLQPPSASLLSSMHRCIFIQYSPLPHCFQLQTTLTAACRFLLCNIGTHTQSVHTRQRYLITTLHSLNYSHLSSLLSRTLTYLDN